MLISISALSASISTLSDIEHYFAINIQNFKLYTKEGHLFNVGKPHLKFIENKGAHIKAKLVGLGKN